MDDYMSSKFSFQIVLLFHRTISSAIPIITYSIRENHVVEVSKRAVEECDLFLEDPKVYFRYQSLVIIHLHIWN